MSTKAKVGKSSEIGETQRLFSSVKIKSSMSSSIFASGLLATVASCQKSPSATLCFQQGICQILKWKS